MKNRILISLVIVSLASTAVMGLLLYFNARDTEKVFTMCRTGVEDVGRAYDYLQSEVSRQQEFEYYRQPCRSKQYYEMSKSLTKSADEIVLHLDNTSEDVSVLKDIQKLVHNYLEKCISIFDSLHIYDKENIKNSLMSTNSFRFLDSISRVGLDVTKYSDWNESIIKMNVKDVCCQITNLILGATIPMDDFFDTLWVDIMNEKIVVPKGQNWSGKFVIASSAFRREYIAASDRVVIGKEFDEVKKEFIGKTDTIIGFPRIVPVTFKPEKTGKNTFTVCYLIALPDCEGGVKFKKVFRKVEFFAE